MKKLSLYIFLVLMFSSVSSYAGGIRDFKLDGMRIGDSLLNYISEDEIKKNIIEIPQYNQLVNIGADFKIEYSVLEFSSSNIEENGRISKKNKSEIILPLENFDSVGFDIKKNDIKFTIQTMTGMIFFENIDDCDKKLHEVSKDVEENLTGYERQKRNKKKHEGDPTGESTSYAINYWFKSGDLISLKCIDFSDTLTQIYGYTDNFSIEIRTNEYNKFLEKLYGG